MRSRPGTRRLPFSAFSSPFHLTSNYKYNQINGIQTYSEGMWCPVCSIVPLAQHSCVCLSAVLYCWLSCLHGRSISSKRKSSLHNCHNVHDLEESCTLFLLPYIISGLEIRGRNCQTHLTSSHVFHVVFVAVEIKEIRNF
jgi:hypothetical protein